MNSKIVFRESAKNEDIASIKEIVESTGFFYDHETEIAVELIEERLNKGIDSGYLFLFAEIDNKVVAYSCYGIIPCTIKSYDLYWIVTHNDYRGKGIGKILLEETHKQIKAMGGSAVYAETSSREKYKPTQYFYESNKYVAEARLKDFYDDGDDKLVYVFRF